MKIESRKSINIRKIVEYLGTDLAANFPKFMQLQGLNFFFTGWWEN